MTAIAKHRANAGHSNGFVKDIHRVSESVARVKEDLSDAAKGVAAVAKSGMHRSLDTVREQGAAVAEELSTQVKARPLSSLAIAAGAGFVLAMMLRRKF